MGKRKYTINVWLLEMGANLQISLINTSVNIMLMFACAVEAHSMYIKRLADRTLVTSEKKGSNKL